MTWQCEGVTCDDRGGPRGHIGHRIVCDEDGDHVFPGTCPTLRRSMTITVAEAGPQHATRPCKVCHPAESE